MRRYRLLLPLVLLVSFIYLLQRPLRRPGPAAGAFLSPFTGFRLNDVPVHPHRQTKDLQLSGLRDSALVQTDTLGIPHIFAHNLPDAFFVQGYLTARERLWQLDFSARAAAGRLAAVLGPKALDYDKHQRRLGLPAAAQKIVARWDEDPQLKSVIQSYSDGINAYILQLNHNHRLPVEFQLLNYKPEPWSPYKTALIFLSMAKTLNYRNHDREMSNLLAALGPDQVRFLFPEFNPKQKVIVPDAGQWAHIPHPLTTATADSTRTPFPPENHSPAHVGSNNWAVAGSKTRHKKPILCNDPHLNLSLPSIWLPIHLHTPELNVMGVSLVGLPGIIIGFNDHIAWGLTNASQDVLDWYRIHWTDSTHTHYRLDDKDVPVTIRYDTIRVRSHHPVIIETRITYWGPVIKDSSDLAMKWLSTMDVGGDELRTFLGLMRARNYKDFRAAVEHFSLPAQNFVFACTDGDIAIRVQGKLPVKNKEQGRFVQDGSTTRNDWHGFIPQEHLPELKNPTRGFVFSANQNPTPPSYPYYYNGDFSDYRCRAIYATLSHLNGLSVEDMMRLQTSSYSFLAADALPLMIEALDTSRLKRGELDMLSRLRRWDYFYRKDRIEPVLFQVWFQQLKMRTWDEILQWEDSLRIRLPDDWRLIALMQDTTHQYFDLISTPEHEDLSDIVTLAFGDMVDQLAERYNEAHYTWADYNKGQIRHLLRFDAFSRPVRADGEAHTINALHGHFGPSWRMIVELGTPVRAFASWPGGVSGNPASPDYDNWVDTWTQGRYVQLSFPAAPLDAAAAALRNTETFAP